MGEPAAFRAHWPAGLEPCKHYEVLCDDKGRKGGSYLRAMGEVMGIGEAQQEDPSQPHTVEDVFNRFAQEGWSGDAAALGIDGFKQAIAALEADPQMALKCNQCKNGCTGRDHTGEACECHYCGGKGVITADEVVKLRDRLEELHGEEMSREIIANEDAAELAQPFTVDWLCEIGGWRHGGYFVTFTASGGERFNYSLKYERWTLQGTIVPNQPKTRGDVLKWLDVLGIEVKKVGDK